MPAPAPLPTAAYDYARDGASAWVTITAPLTEGQAFALAGVLSNSAREWGDVTVRAASGEAWTVRLSIRRPGWVRAADAAEEGAAVDALMRAACDAAVAQLRAMGFEPRRV